MTTPRKSDKDPFVQMKEEMLEAIRKNHAREQGGDLYFRTTASGNTYEKLAALEPTKENMETFLRTEAWPYNKTTQNMSFPIMIDITGYLAQCQAAQLKQVKEALLLDQFRVDAAIMILQAIHTQRGDQNIKQNLSDLVQAILLEKKSPEDIFLRLEVLSAYRISAELHDLHRAYLKNEKLLQATKAAEKVAEPAQENVNQQEHAETKAQKQSSGNSSLKMWKKHEDPRLSSIENKCDEMLKDNSKGQVWIEKHNTDVKKVNSDYQELVDEASKTKDKGMQYRLHNLGQLVEGVNKKSEKSQQAYAKNNK